MGVTLLSTAAADQPLGGSLSNNTLSNLTTDIATLQTALGTGTATAPTGSGAVVLATSPTLVTPNLGVPSAITLPASQLRTITVPLTLAQLIASNSVPISVLAAQGAGTLIQVLDWTFDLIRGSAAFVGGGAMGLYLGTDATGVLASATIAATFFTTFAASHIIYAAGALAVNNSSAILNTGLVMANPTADFTVGTGGSGIVTVTYRVISGLS